ncbi:hypothetical protein F4778DRAFT_799032 [Xylariomycetidae sp. FL2044]|nr:hypothetical protein F4778DRAFT_801959 [Xylariomycetidae sp. FL2044]KAH9883418.1 hypothetical protein F4778DRAFT_788619 [Xylariomycetidae sp. FL2044]KAH9885295.1 hypothetical protein F4778DRAFT_799032 [Xylariomycetidae sp. FL2044]
MSWPPSSSTVGSDFALAPPSTFSPLCHQHPRPEPTMIVDPDGDLNLIVGADKCYLDPGIEEASTFMGAALRPLPAHDHDLSKTFRVCSRSLSRASHFFKGLLHGNFAESSPADGAKWRVCLPDDNPEAMTMILYMVHSQFELILDEITLKELYEITVITDKYDLTHILRPWINEWYRKWHGMQCLSHIGTPDTWKRHLWIAWVIGDKIQFIELVKKIAYNSNFNGVLVYEMEPSKAPLLEDVPEPDLDGLIETTRLSMLQALMRPAIDLFDTPKAVCGRLTCGNKLCGSLILGSAILALEECEFQRDDAVPTTYEDTPKSLQVMFYSASTRTTSFRGHDACELVLFSVPQAGLDERIDDVIATFNTTSRRAKLAIAEAREVEPDIANSQEEKQQLHFHGIVLGLFSLLGAGQMLQHCVWVE